MLSQADGDKIKQALRDLLDEIDEDPCADFGNCQYVYAFGRRRKMIDNWTVPSFTGDDLPEQEVEPEKVRFDVIRWDEGAGDIYYDGYLLYSKELDEDGEDDLFEALVGLGYKMAARGYVDMVEQEREGGIR